MSATIHIQVMIYSIMMENGFDFLFLHCVIYLVPQAVPGDNRIQNELSFLIPIISQEDIQTLVRQWLLPIETCPGFLFLD